MLSGQLTGVGLYASEICQRLMARRPEVEFYVYSPAPTTRFEGIPNCTYRVDSSVWASRLKLVAWTLFRSGQLAGGDRLDAFWGPCHFLPLTLPRHVSRILTVHDVVYKECPSTMTTSQWASHAAFFRHSLRSASFVVANSEGTAKKVRARFGRKVDAVARPGVPEAWRRASDAEVEIVRRKYRIDSPYLLAVSTIEPRKNYGQLIRAFLALKEAGQLAGHSLLIVGQAGWKCHDDVALIESAKSKGVLWLGFVESADLSAIYSGAALFVCPSIYEGYGIPAAEARACSVDSLLTDIAELHESGGLEARYTSADQRSLETAIATSVFGKNFSRPPPPDIPRWQDAADRYAEILDRALPADPGAGPTPSAIGTSSDRRAPG